MNHYAVCRPLAETYLELLKDAKVSICDMVMNGPMGRQDHLRVSWAVKQSVRDPNVLALRSQPEEGYWASLVRHSDNFASCQ